MAHEGTSKSPEFPVEKIKLLLDIYEQDRKQVMLFVAVCFAIPGFALAHTKPEDLSQPARLFLFFSLALFICAGWSFFRYAQYQNWRRIWSSGRILAMDPVAVRDWLMGRKSGSWAHHRGFYIIAMWLLGFASFFFVVFFVFYLFPEHNPFKWLWSVLNK